MSNRVDVGNYYHLYLYFEDDDLPMRVIYVQATDERNAIIIGIASISGSINHTIERIRVCKEYDDLEKDWVRLGWHKGT